MMPYKVLHWKIILSCYNTSVDVLVDQLDQQGPLKRFAKETNKMSVSFNVKVSFLCEKYFN